MSQLRLENIQEIKKNLEGKGYLIVFNDERSIVLYKRRTIPALLTLIRLGEGCESDLTTDTNNLPEIKEILAGKILDDLIKDSYSDTNKLFSELWTEEGFNFIYAPQGQKRLGSPKYVLNIADHDRLFTASKPTPRKPPSKRAQNSILEQQNNQCNFCGSILKTRREITNRTYARDRVRLVWDHRIPVEKGGNSEDTNFQALCFYCNKCKWQICSFCTYAPEKCLECVLAHPEKTNIIFPTGENIEID
ncbi:HNH endonuclease signature motif containing protein [Pannus brasiliensis CCIBt3594]|uniref:HNH endonuclease signature motif containing protein n=1 Tax=Pannus brasiliensis CCIBt3594 TaxID=1427578 RepID=A0AAW9R159_9CHRO